MHAHRIHIIIDEVSMISNVTLLFIHLQLTEISNAEDVEGGWFGNRNLFFGIFCNCHLPIYTGISADIARKHTGCLLGVNLCEALFTYDGLTLNMQQKDEQDFVSLLSRVRTGHIMNDDVNTLEDCLLPLHSTTITGRMKEIVAALGDLPSDTVCLLPTRHMCIELNLEVLKSLPGEEICLIAADSVDYMQTTK